MWIRCILVSVDHFSGIGLEKDFTTGCTTCINIDNRTNAMIPTELDTIQRNDIAYIRVFDIVHSNKCMGCIL